MNKEQIYDAEISPLMAQIIAICQKHKISMFATFDIPNDDDETLTCTTATTDESEKLSKRIAKFGRLNAELRGTHHATMITTKNADGSMTMTAVL